MCSIMNNEHNSLTKYLNIVHVFGKKHGNKSRLDIEK